MVVVVEVRVESDCFENGLGESAGRVWEVLALETCSRFPLVLSYGYRNITMNLILRHHRLPNHSPSKNKQKIVK